MNKKILFSLVLIFTLIITISSCNSSNDNNLSTGANLQNLPDSGTTWHIKFKPNSTAFIRQQCVYILERTLVDSIRATPGYSSHGFSVSQVHDPFGDTLYYQIKIAMKGNVTKTPYSLPRPVFLSTLSDSIPIRDPVLPGPGSFYVFCVQVDSPCE